MSQETFTSSKRAVHVVSDVQAAPDRRSYPYRFVKRFLDIVSSILMLAICLIPGIILSIAVVVDTHGSPFYTQVRVGKGGRVFRIFKFRTMVADSDNVRRYFDTQQMEEWEHERKVDHDPRITRLGKFLREHSIDEIPNFINVLLGQMSVIGPRAIVPEELRWFGDEASDLLSVPCGITGWWQVNARNDATFVSGRRQELELYYVHHANVSLDTEIFFRTFAAVFGGTGK